MIDRGKRSKTLSEVKPVKNISKNFLEMILMQKEDLHINYDTMYISKITSHKEIARIN